MLTLLLAMALLVIFAAAIVPSITFDIRRDREEEMIHRGVQYSRAIRAYYKKFGRYPTKIEDLESANNLRFLRKRYKDPLNCKNLKCEDFKLLHFGEVQLSLSGIGGGIPGANAIGPNGALNGGTAGGFGQNNAFGANSNSSFGQNPAASNASSGSDPSQAGAPGSSSGTSAGTSAATPGDTTGGTADAASNSSGTGNGASGSSPFASGQIIGGPIVGVASTVKDKTIREFNHKNKYKDWVFVYDPAQDRGLLITTPYQPQVPGFGQPGMQNINGQMNGQINGGQINGQPGSAGFGTGLPSGMQNTPTTPVGGPGGTPNPPNNPPNNPPEQQ